MMQAEVTYPSPVPWTPREVWLGVISLPLLLVGSTLADFGLAHVFPRLDFGLVVSFGEALLLIPVWWLAIRKYGADWQSLGLRRFGQEALGLGCGMMFLAYAFTMAYSMILAQFNLRVQSDFVRVFTMLSTPWFLLFGGVLVAPFAEEIFFRGFVFAGLAHRYGWKKAAFVSSALFALVHLEPLAIIPIFLLGYLFAYLYHRTNSILPGMLMHVSTNALALGISCMFAYLSTR